jgi:hypothetical protein
MNAGATLSLCLAPKINISLPSLARHMMDAVGSVVCSDQDTFASRKMPVLKFRIADRLRKSMQNELLSPRLRR